jgi:hypothetical protein
MPHRACNGITVPFYYNIIILWDHCRLCGTLLTETSLWGAYLYVYRAICCFNNTESCLCACSCSRLRLKCDCTREETRFRLSAKRTSLFKSARGGQFSRLLAAEVCASAVIMLDTPYSEVVWSGTGYPLHLPVSPSLPFPCVTVCHHISTGLYTNTGPNNCVRIQLLYGWPFYVGC